MNRLMIKMLFAAALIAVTSSVASAGAPGHGRKVVIIVADRVGISDVTNPSLENISRLIGGGAIGLMNTRVLGGHSSTAACATIGAGVRAIGISDSAISENASLAVDGVSAASAYSARTAFPAPKTGIVNLGIAKLVLANTTTSWAAVPGSLGSILAENKFRVSVIGNSDTDQDKHREAAMIVMDTQGYIPSGDVSTATLMVNTSAPFGLSLNMDYVEKMFAEEYERSGVVLVDFGDTARMDYFSDFASPAALEIAKTSALNALDDFVGFVLGTIDGRTTMVMLLVPTPSFNAYDNKQTLTPLIISAPGVAHGMLISPATRRKGLVTNMDIAVTITSFLGIPTPDFMLGAPIRIIARKDPAPALMNFYNKDAAVEFNSVLLKFIITFQLVLFIICFLTAATGGKFHVFRRNALQALVFIAAAVDLALLLIAPVFVNGIQGYLGVLVVALVVLFLLVLPAKSPAGRMAVLAFLYFAAIVIEQFFGARLSRESLLGYYPQVGARYYGLGNEFMGFLISAPILFCGIMLDLKQGRKLWKIAAFAMFALSLFIVASPSHGANVGGMISCAFAFAWMLWTMSGRRVSLNAVLGAGAAAAALLVLLVLADTFILKSTESHLGQLVDRVMANGWTEFLNVVVRKLSVNIRLLTGSWWSTLFIAEIAGAYIILRYPHERLKKLFAARPNYKLALGACMAGTIMAFLANDSGVVAGATCLVLPVFSFFSIFFNENFRNI